MDTPAWSVSSTAGSAAESATDAAVFCHVCGIWLNGSEQYFDHLRGRKHRRRTLQPLSRRAAQFATHTTDSTTSQGELADGVEDGA
eukprot:2374618-Lingulodinium_polyedra.AAC.1